MKSTEIELVRDIETEVELINTIMREAGPDLSYYENWKILNQAKNLLDELTWEQYTGFVVKEGRKK